MEIGGGGGRETEGKSKGTDKTKINGGFISRGMSVKGRWNAS